MSTKHPIPYLYWAPLASLWVALTVLAGLAADPYLAAASVAGLGLLGLCLRLNSLNAKRLVVLSATVALLDAKLNSRTGARR